MLNNYIFQLILSEIFYFNENLIHCLITGVMKKLVITDE